MSRIMKRRRAKRKQTEAQKTKAMSDKHLKMVRAENKANALKKERKEKLKSMKY